MLKPFLTTLISLFLIAFFVPAVTYSSWVVLIVASLILTILLKIVRPILKVLFLPINIVTLGLFSVVINVLILWLVMMIVPGFHIRPVVVAGLHFNQFFTLVLLSGVLGFVQRLVYKIL